MDDLPHDIIDLQNLVFADVNAENRLEKMWKRFR